MPEEIKKDYIYKGYKIQHIMFGSMNFWKVSKKDSLFSWEKIADLGTEQQCKEYIYKL